ncbi:MAG TPA: aminotransferase class III-fold pyridoxal phosphate-dependent enzyme [Anaerolineales bacterium]|nr:aminotransferase class III-fold pyridoxal phosphate-dependent enzyme [Anaerolineales bacterium]
MNDKQQQINRSEGFSASQAIIDRDDASVASTIYRYTDIVFQRGEGVYLYDFEGRQYLDFVSGIATMNVGHCHPQVVEAICDQAQTLIHGASHVGFLEPYVDMLEALKDAAPGELKSGKGILVNSGSEAVETGIKLARYVTDRAMIIAFTDSFHGRSMGALALTASNTLFRRRLSGLLPGVHHTPYPYCFRCPLKHESADDCQLACLNLVEKALETVVPPEDLAGIVFEPIAGEGGYIVPPDGFLAGLREICDRVGALLIVDEVQTGLGRTGKMFAVEHWDVEPDVICLAKALGGGLPLGAVLAKGEIIDQWPPAAQGTTFGGNPIACRAGLATLKIIQEQDLMVNAVEVGEFIQTRFRGAQEDLAIIGDVRGKGLMVAVELVNSDGSPAVEIIKAVIKDMGNNGIVLTKCGASALRFAPPLIISKEQAGAGVDIILSVLGSHQWK